MQADEDIENRRSLSEPLAKVLLLTALTLVASALLQVALFSRGGSHALSDIPGRYIAWGLSPRRIPYVDAPVEYPVGIGIISWLVAMVTRSAGSFFVAIASANAVLALVMSAVMREGTGRRALRWCIGPPLFFYAFHNWDLWAILPMVLGLLAFERRKDVAAGVGLGLGAAIKLFPAFVVPPLVIKRWCEGDRRGALRLLASAGAVVAVLNGPFALIDRNGWEFPLKFQGARVASWGSLWFWLERVPPIGWLFHFDRAGVANVGSFAVLGAGLIVIAVAATRHHSGAIEVGAAVIALFLLSNKIYSPTYDLWMVPFFVLLPIQRRTWITYCAADAGIFVLVFGHFHGLWSTTVVLWLLFPLVALRAGSLLEVAVSGWRRNRAPETPLEVRVEAL